MFPYDRRPQRHTNTHTYKLHKSIVSSGQMAGQQLVIVILLVIVVLQNGGKENNITVAVMRVSGAEIMSKRLQSENRISPDATLISNRLLLFTYSTPSAASPACSTSRV